MDQREEMASYFMQRGNPNLNIQFQSTLGGGSIGPGLSSEPLPAIISPHGVSSAGGGGIVVPSSGEPMRRKRGRPRKYGPEGSMALALSPSSSAPPTKLTPIQKKGRGRPPGPGPGRKQQLTPFGQSPAGGSVGTGFTPNVITVAVGEDITTKIVSFSQQGRKAICILSASGAVSTVTLRQPSSSGGTISYEGRFEILCLSGSYVPTATGGRSGGLSISLANSDGRVVGGGVGGRLIAATPVQVIVGSFLLGNSKTKNKPGDIAAEDFDNPVSPSSSNLQPIQNYTPMGVWPGSQTDHMQNTHIDLDLMHR